MLPKLRIILAAMLATCATVLALSAGVLGARPGDDLAGVPQVSRTLVRQAIVADPEPEQLQLLAYSRRADELLRLRDLPMTPTRAVVEYAEQAQARTAETSAPTAPAATSPIDPATAPASESVTAAAPIPTVEAPPADSAAAATTDAPPPSMVAMAPVTSPHADTAATSPMARPASPAPIVTAPPADTQSAPADSTPAPNAAPAETAAANDAKVAAVAPGGSATAEIYGPEKPKIDGKPHRRAKVVHPKPRKKPQVAAGTTQPASTPAPTASTAYPVNQPNNRNNGLGGWRYDSTAR